VESDIWGTLLLYAIVRRPIVREPVSATVDASGR